MWCRSYRDHVIMAFPSFDTATNLWAPQASISWVVGSARKSDFVRFAKRVFTEAEAAACALSAGQSWVDSRLKELGAGAGRESEKVAVSPPASPTYLLKKHRAKSHREDVRDSHRLRNVLTFDQFKSWMGRADPNISEQLLQKSYAALVQLRKHHHRSWAQIIDKMKNSQAHVGEFHAASRNAKSAQLPLTLRDWRRII